ncbi:porin family protein [Phaeodactylibacter luteus]|uniref:Porin family protein n=2 Tax=Phaeodactylibacter luteus TaxID=1564516 RepID=A0A5C6RIN3_9BACT|nr:porin family protein [Phaeodactylibacter luteus]
MLFLFLLAAVGGSLQAQRGWEAGGWLGGAFYLGDLNTNYDFSRPGMAGGLVARYNFNERLCFKASANVLQVSADDANSSNPFEQARNLSFQSNVVDGTFQFEFNFLPYRHGHEEHFFTPYLLAGFNVFRFNPKAEYEGELVELRPLGTEGQFRGEEYYSVSGGLAYGVGFKVDLSYEWSLNFELNARSLFTDYLDDVSTVYADKGDLEQLRGPLSVALSDRSLETAGSQIGREGTQRGNSNNNDTFITMGVSLVYYFGDIRCPEYGRR